MNNLDIVIKDPHGNVKLNGHTVTYGSKAIRKKIESLLNEANTIVLPKEYTYEVIGNDEQDSLFKIVPSNVTTRILCVECNTETPMQWDKHHIILNNKRGTVKELSFMFCDDCGAVRFVELS